MPHISITFHYRATTFHALAIEQLSLQWRYYTVLVFQEMKY